MKRFLPQQASADHQLSVFVENLSATTLRVRYTFQNKGSNSIFLFNKFWASASVSDATTIVADELNIQVLDGYILASKALIPVPAGLEVEREYVPYQSKVAAQDTYEELLELPLPLTPHTCYTMPWDQPAGTHVANLPLYFELGYVEATPETEGYFKAIETPQGRMYSWSSAYQHQLVLRAGPLAMKIPVYTS